MSSDSNRPNSEWWKQPAPQVNDDADPFADQGSEETRAIPLGNAGYPQAGPGYPQAGPGYPQETQAYPQESQGYPQGKQAYSGSQDYQDYQGTRRRPEDQGYTAPAAQDYQAPPRMRRRRRRWPVITLIVIVLILVAADRGAAAYTEDQMASQVQSSLALSGKPNVTIQGIPFLTQLAGRDFKTVDVNASNETTGPLEIESLTATLHGMHIHGLNSATIDQFTASALVNFTALAKVGGIPQGITLSADGSNKVKADISIGPLSDTAIAQVTQSGAGQINVKVIDAGGIPVSALGSLANFNVNIPKLPAGVAISSVSVTQQGVRITASGRNTTLSQ